MGVLDPATIHAVVEQANLALWAPVMDWLSQAVELDEGESAILGMARQVNDPAPIVWALGGHREVVSQRRLCLAVRFACLARASRAVPSLGDFVSIRRKQELCDQVREVATRLFVAWRDPKADNDDTQILDCLVTLEQSDLVDVLGWLIDGFLKPDLDQPVLARFQDALIRMNLPLMQRADLLWRLLNVIRERYSGAAIRTTALIKSFGLNCPKGLIDELLRMWRDPECTGRLIALDIVSNLAPESYTEVDVREFIGLIRGSDRCAQRAGLEALNHIASRLPQYLWAIPVVVGAFSVNGQALSPAVTALLNRFRDAAGPERTELISLAMRLSDGVKLLRESQQNPRSMVSYGCGQFDGVLQALAKLGVQAAEYPGVVEDISHLLLAWQTYPSNIDEAAKTLGLLSKVSVSTARVIPMLLKWLSSEEPYVGSNVAQALVAMRDLVCQYPGAMQTLRSLLAEPEKAGCMSSLEVWAGMIEHANSEPGMVELLVPCVFSKSSGLSQLAVGVLSDCADRGNQSEWVRELLRAALRNPTWHSDPGTRFGKGTPANPRAEAALRVARWALTTSDSPMGREDLLVALACPVTSWRLLSGLCRPGQSNRIKSWAADEIVEWLNSQSSGFYEDPLPLIGKLDLTLARADTIAWVCGQLGISVDSPSARLELIDQELVRRGIVSSAASFPAPSTNGYGPAPLKPWLSTWVNVATQAEPPLTNSPLSSSIPLPWRHRPGRELAPQLLRMAKVDSPAALIRLYVNGEPSPQEIECICGRVRFIFLDGTYAVREDNSEPWIQIVARWVWVYQRLIPDADPGYRDLAFEILLWGMFYELGFVHSWPTLLLLLSDMKAAEPADRYRFVEGLMSHVQLSWGFYNRNKRERFRRLLTWPIDSAVK